MNSERAALLERILEVSNDTFDAVAIDVFRYQSAQNDLYQTYLKSLSFKLENVKSIEDIPCLPIQFFKTHTVQTGSWSPSLIFESSGTSGTETSKHLLREMDVYKALSFRCFEHTYGSVSDWCFLALLPHYLERKGSSLVQMVQSFTKGSSYEQSGFYLDNIVELIDQIRENQQSEIPTILIGVSFALLDLADNYDLNLSGIIVMETGGMKGRREEWSKSELHSYLKQHFKIDQIHSEYGMTELMSQCYSKDQGIFRHSPSMKTIIKEIADPFEVASIGKTGILNIVDLGNLDTCSFIETEDLGRRIDEDHFTLEGRLDHSDIRGCNLLIAQ